MAERARYHFWCANCATVTQVDTAQSAGEAGYIFATPPEPPPCPMCGAQTDEWAALVSRGETPQDEGDWRAFELWRRWRAAQAALKRPTT